MDSLVVGMVHLLIFSWIFLIVSTKLYISLSLLAYSCSKSIHFLPAAYSSFANYPIFYCIDFSLFTYVYCTCTSMPANGAWLCSLGVVVPDNSFYFSYLYFWSFYAYFYFYLYNYVSLYLALILFHSSSYSYFETAMTPLIHLTTSPISSLFFPRSRFSSSCLAKNISYILFCNTYKNF